MNAEKQNYLAALISLVTSIITLIGTLVSTEFNLALVLLITIVLVLSITYWMLATFKKDKSNKKNTISVRILNSSWIIWLITAISILTAILFGILWANSTNGNYSSKTTSHQSFSSVARVVSNEVECNGRDLTGLSSVVGVARFSQGEEDFSEFVISEIEHTSQKSLIDFSAFGLDEHIPLGLDGDRAVQKLRTENCIDTGMVVHGSRNPNEKVFFCKIHFFNYHRIDTLIRNPIQVEFSYSGHSKYLADFIVAHEFYRRGNYDKAVRLLLEARKQNIDTSFVSLTNFYIGNAYLELGQSDKAKQFFFDALDNSAVKDDALWQLDQLLKREASIAEIKKDQKYGAGDFNRVFADSMHNMFGNLSSNYYIRVDPDSWDLSKTKDYVSKWLLYRNDSLTCYRLKGYVQEDGDFYYVLRTIWSTPVIKGAMKSIIRLDVNSSPLKRNKLGLGWGVYFLPQSKYDRAWTALNLEYDWYVTLCREEQQSYKVDSKEMIGIESKRMHYVESQLRDFSRKSGLELQVIRLYTDDVLERR